MKILIFTGHFHPEIHPRAFRASELACEFSSTGHEVTVITLRTITSFDYKKYEQNNNLKVCRINLYSRPEISVTPKKSSRSNFILFILKIYRFLLDYFIGGNLFINSFKIKKELKKIDDFNLIISLSTPFMNHLGMALIRKQIANLKTIFVADSGDPFYRSQQTKRAPYFYYLEKYVYKKFDFLTVPAKASLDAYKGLVEPNKIKIIPQGFNMENIKLGKVSPSEKITFAYSGVFYSDIRNPEFLLKTLVDLDIDFRFDIYLRHSDLAIDKLINKYTHLLGDKLNIKYGIKRDDLIYHLSTVDFLINIGNLTTTQIPSKLIDYAITKRPIYSCNSSNYYKEDFMRFLRRDYSNSLNIDVSNYDIKKVASQFIELIDEA